MGGILTKIGVISLTLISLLILGKAANLVDRDEVSKTYKFEDDDDD
ncbi:hypothetical protein [Pseudobacteroides cellulosolvens]|uniref:Uncharacterized protein n=1 Tax=Pseudobacteroides cellulosolvens ATCC 35603 = DSM 2933 TaxID=398512 RepID=A0A0L6JWP7_9FIRM|nr:hypothetical protein [Pseudobacteroides cellulosolvens]KNY30271.1 hypothetical protein Bccel_5548 [Pseudobacteroides cellulosolvens ATCC 35603 = DSM 2933]